ncbi:ricin-type beta-trefoil lectin domain protein [Streptomyces sp. NPDC006326]|uniref:ricin-type beta-trefoil lectin domain protein n=1 Tax=Streptomyces sp. NPDC006326 TaxID=3156752 RepID=UPI0033ACCD07
MLVASLLPVQAWAAPPGDRTGVTLPGLQQDLKAKLDKLEAAKLEGWAGTPSAPPPGYEPSKVTPPAGAPVDVPLTTATGDQLVQAGSLPVSIGKASPTESNPTPPAPSGTWSVAVEARAATEAADVDGAIITVTPPSGGSTPVDVQLDYKQFKDLFGTEWSTRLQIKQLPQCFLSTPTLPECSVAKDVPSSNDPGSGTVRATVDPATAPNQGLRTMAVGGGGPVVLAASDSGSGAGGTYTATPLAATGSWTAGGSGGGFTWSYPLSVPAPPAGPSPSIAFSYSSQAVDGRTSVSNGQASWIGDGWDYEPGFIERRYRSCSQDRKASPSAPNNDNSADKKKSDLCWAGDNVVMSLGGSSTELVHDASSGRWIPASDDGSRIELKTDTTVPNGAKDGEYWVVTTRDGTRYFFGRHDVDGAGTRPVTNSVFTVPVFGNHPGEPCYKPAFADSSCTQGWRWNLDYVEDVNGNAMIIDWKPETNYYAKNEKSKEKVPYVRGGYPAQITYGLRAGSLNGPPAAKVDFGVDERCIQEGGVKCGDPQFESKNYADKQPWWDTPSTLNCKSDVKDCYVSAPTFWTRKRLTAVTTSAQRTPGSTELSLVDKWQLTQSFPKQRTDTHPPLWLESITRTGYGTAKDVAGNQLSTKLPAVSFLANVKDMPNRVAKSATDATPDFDRLRVETIRNETGGEVYIDYSDPCPVGSSHPKPEENTTRCYPAHWSPDSDLETPPLEWFNKYVVEKVVEKDRVARQPDVTTSYAYEGGAAWAKDNDEFTKPELRTYNQWRGYASVVTHKGVTANTGKTNATEESQTQTRYFRGMSGDAGRPKITVKDSTNKEDLGEDLPQLQGLAAETITYAKTGGDVVTRQLTWPMSEKTGSRPRDGTTALDAFRSGTSRTDEIESISQGRTRVVRTRNEYDKTYGLLEKTQVEALTSNGTGWTTSETSCTATSYVNNPDKNIIGLAQRVRVTAGDCTKTATGSVLSDTRTSYDALNAFGTPPVKGLPVQIDTIDAAGTGWIPTSRTDYDALGRPVKVLDAAGNPTTTSYSPATGPAFSTTATNPLGHAATTKVDPGRGSILEITDANSRKVTSAYDNLGRLTSVWTPSQKPTDKPAHAFAYQITEHEPPVVISSTLRDNGTYENALAIYDGLLRPRQTQKEGLGGGRLITDTLYSENGTVSRTKNNYYAEGEPESKIFVPETDFHVPNSTDTAYDGMGRVVRSTTLYSDPAEKPTSTTIEYGGDWTLTRTGMSADTVPVPLQGSRAVKSTTDALGRTTLIQHAATVTSPMTWRDTAYTYDNRGQLTRVTDPAGNNWTYAYDARGRRTGSSDPDMGASSFGFDNLDRQIWTKDAAGRARYTSYDALGRPTELRDDAADGPLVSSWTYDSLLGAKGQPVASIRYEGGAQFKNEVTGYDAEYRPTGTKITIPDVPVAKGLAGTYAYSTTYTATGNVQSTTLPATPGGLAAEKLINRYNADGALQSMSGLSWYTADTIYSPFGDVLRTTSGDAPNRVWSTNLYNPNTGRVRESTTDRETTNFNLVSQLSYQYDPVGNITSVTDTQPQGRVDRQCFTYDPLGQLTQAWTGKTCTGAVKDDVTAGPDKDGFWKQYSFDTIGNRTKLIDHDLVDPALDDEQTYTYGAQPHALAKVDTVTRKPGTTITSQSTYAYDSSGNTIRRTIGGDTQTLNWDRSNKLTSAAGAGVGAVAVTGLSGKCLDVEGGNATDGTAVQLWSCKEVNAQEWRLTGDTVRALGQCLTAESGRARLFTCDGSERQKFVYRAADKSLYNPAANACLDVPAWDATDGNDLLVYACSSGAANQQWNVADTTTKYIYDAAGNRLLEETGTSRTLYLGETEITVNKAGEAIDAVRYYGSPGSPTTIRRTEGRSQSHQLSVLVADHHNTATASIDQNANQKVTRRKNDPYGNPRGNPTANWSGDRTFLGVGVEDASTGLTHIGAREYDPTTGRFISADPIIDISDPLQMNGYTYANGDPINRADPTGLCQGRDAHGSGCSAATPGKDYVTPDNPATTKPPKGNSGGKSTVVIQKSGKSIVVNNVYIPTHDQLVAQYKWATKNHTYAQDLETWTRSQCQPASVPEGNESFCGAASAMGWMGSTQDADILEIIGLRNQYDCLGGDGGACNDAATDAAVDYAITVLTRGLGKAGTILFKMIKTGMKKGDNLPVECLAKALNSFPAGTLVQLSDGTVKPIEALENGDEVLATDPETGETAGQSVTAIIVSDTDKHYVELTLAGDGASVVTTDHHPFWSESEKAWVDAGSLKAGMQLRTDDGSVRAVAATRAFDTRGLTYNLTVADVHTYYVLAGTTPVLVHNTSPVGPGCGTGKAPRTPDGKFSKRNGEPGTDGSLDERTVLDQLELDGAPVIRGQVYARVPGFPLRKYDGAVQIDGRWLGVETKGGTSPLTPPQRAFDNWLNTPGNSVTTSGGITLEGTFNAWVPR